MKFLITALALSLFSTAAFSKETLICKDGSMRAEIVSACKLATSAFEDVRAVFEDVRKKSSRIKIYKNNTLVSDSTYSCNGISINDIVFFTTSFNNEKQIVEYTLADDFGLSYAQFVDFEPAIAGTYRLKCR